MINSIRHYSKSVEYKPKKIKPRFDFDRINKQEFIWLFLPRQEKNGETYFFIIISSKILQGRIFLNFFSKSYFCN